MPWFALDVKVGDAVKTGQVLARNDARAANQNLVSMYDPTSLRVTVSVPQSAALGLQKDAALRIQLPGPTANG